MSINIATDIIGQVSTFLRQKRLHLYGRIRRKEEDNLSRKIMDMVVPGKRRRGRPRWRWIDNNREDMCKYELTADMTENRQTVLEDDGKDWPTKKWRWSLKVRKVRQTYIIFETSGATTS